MSEQDMTHFIEIINRRKPHVIEAYVQSLYELVKLADERKIELFSPLGIIVSAGTLFEFIEKMFKKVLKTRIYNRYGSRSR